MQGAVREPEYWKLVFPGFAERRMYLPPDALACTGAAVFQDPAFAGVSPVHEEAGAVKEGDIIYGGGGAQLKLLWFQTHRTSDGGVVGPLAMVRVADGVGEVYAVGVHRGRAQPRLSLQRMGPEVLAAVLDEGCVGRTEGQPCESTVTLYRPFHGEMRQLEQIAVERVAFGEDSEPGVIGRIEYRLVSSIDYKEDRVVILEQITATDSEQREVRHAEVEYTRTLGGGAETKSAVHSGEEPTGTGSLWPLVVTRISPPKTGAESSSGEGSEDLPESGD